MTKEDRAAYMRKYRAENYETVREYEKKSYNKRKEKEFEQIVKGEVKLESPKFKKPFAFRLHRAEYLSNYRK